MSRVFFSYSVFVLLLCPSMAAAYIGPGLGAGALAAVLGILGGIGLLLVGIIWYPVKRLYKQLKSKKK